MNISILQLIVAFTVCLSAVAAESDLVLRVPNMDAVSVRSNVTYKVLSNSALKADVYLPPDISSKASLPAIIFVLGDASPEVLRHAKDWRVFHSYGRLAAASGLVGITFNHRSSENCTKLSDVNDDISNLIGFVRTNSRSFFVDKDRLCLWFFSGAGPHVGIAMQTNSSFVRCIVAYYPLLGVGTGAWDSKRFSAVDQLKRHAPHVPPILLAKADRDDHHLNSLIDEFLRAAEESKTPVDFLEHPNGHHAFDIVDDDETSRDILRKTMQFVRRHLVEPKP